MSPKKSLAFGALLDHTSFRPRRENKQGFCAISALSAHTLRGNRTFAPSLKRSRFKQIVLIATAGLRSERLLLALLILVEGAARSVADDPVFRDKVSWGGFAFCGNASNISNSYPI